MSLDILRRELQFNGVSITDDLDMKAIADHYSVQEIAGNIVDGEINFMIFNHSFDHARDVYDALSRQLKQNPGKAAIIARRTDQFMTALEQHSVQVLSQQHFDKHALLSQNIPEGFAVDIKDFTGD